MRYLVFILFSVFAMVAHAQMNNVIVTQSVQNPIKIAVVPFDWAGGRLPEDVSSIIRNDFRFSGQFDPIAPERMLSFPVSEVGIHYRDWKVLGAEYLLIGSLTQQAGRYYASYELFDVVKQQRVFAKLTVDGTELQLRDIAHHISDKVYETITGIRGIFSTKLIYVEAYQHPQRYRLMLSDIDGARSRALLDSRFPILSPVWSPNGQRVAYVSFEAENKPAIYIMDIATQRRQQMTSFRGLNGAPSWSPDGQKLAMVLSKDGNPEIYVMNVLTRQLDRVTNHFAIDSEPSWAADGASLYFTSDRGGKPQIYQVNLATKQQERVTFDGDYNARSRVSPDGKYLVVLNKRPGGNYHIAAQDLKTGNLRILSETNLDESPSIAPNGAMLMYATRSGGKGVLAAVSLDARVKILQPPKQGDVREPAWSPFFN
ncbi:tolB protein [Cellvibrio japonicus Ueda107]|uniref:Tol-Pal system protein TolB n=2 Tax=Cellvibrio japonicus TaxID=155077 RepID=B3PB63_CELJU|nr:tolB protein [Cellvibrio japonicus Ueda107]QEI11653.1 Tol-Pal system protein TolB [Cellvibrio japonicus]QEI15227.1 Tol-Pal system protein TolB [Cellvibrio japonicus]QEI18807.1 Tol-Pal system protein TolB [Cellvibrio japonicus]